MTDKSYSYSIILTDLLSKFANLKTDIDVINPTNHELSSLDDPLLFPTQIQENSLKFE